VDSKDDFEVLFITPDREVKAVVNRNEYLWSAAQRNGLELPAICHQGRCLTCAGRLIGEGDFDQSAADSYFPEDREAGFILLCTAKPLSALRISTHQEKEMRKHRIAHKLPAPYS
jgi:ferredoxin